MDSAPHDNPARSRFELVEEGHLARAEYLVSRDVITFTHTIVPPELGGRGVASRLIAFALADARARGMKVVPQCPFVRAYIEKHPEWADLLA
ncbi:GNAT family N-acetyltransferase [Sphingomonas canadensis]|uniref:GNAT family N-acetyltransferase n=1 Tax=Sphingomonas canadensis TaxID=1219257 RepID=A0ABW3H1Y6_9SPHN|nr:GNAT family N-acetyltransferase [Sphingomonas canadensis]MCW3834609.1 N-acetyltransferase [Sphingomonas canadensis]